MGKNLNEVIDWDEVSQFTNNDQELAQNIITLLIRCIHDEYVPNISQFVKAQDFESLSKICHKIAGGSRYCGTHFVEEAAGKLEKAAKKQDLKKVQKYADELLVEMKKVPEAFEKRKEKH